MAKINFTSVDDYIASQTPSVQITLERVRSAIRKAIPSAQEAISYQMPTYTLDGRRLLYFAVWKHHYSLYAATEQVLAAFRDELAPDEIDKGTIRFLIGTRPREVNRKDRKIPCPRKSSLGSRSY